MLKEVVNVTNTGFDAFFIDIPCIYIELQGYTSNYSQ